MESPAPSKPRFDGSSPTLAAVSREPAQRLPPRCAALVALTSGETRLALELRLGLMLESAAADAPDSDDADRLLGEAMDRYASALELDSGSLTAATGLARLASRHGNAEAALVASESLSRLADDPRTRARYLLDAAEILLGAADLVAGGSGLDRRERAASMLERALDADPDSVPAAGRLATVLLEEGQSERLVTAFRAALGRATGADAIVMFGSEIARVARDELHDLPVGIDALRKVRAAAPQHVPSLLTLAELCIAQRVWPEAVDTLEAISLHRAVSSRPSSRRSLRSRASTKKVLESSRRCGSCPSHRTGGRPLERAGRCAPLYAASRENLESDNGEAAAQSSGEESLPTCSGAWHEVETDLEQKSGILGELSDVQDAAREKHAPPKRRSSEQWHARPPNIRAFTRLSALFSGCRRP